MRDLLLTLTAALSLTSTRAPHDILELNHVYYEDGSHMTQLVAWDWWQDDHYCSGYEIIRKGDYLSVMPGKLWCVTHNGRRIYARQYRETSYPWDVEVNDRDRVECSRRSGMRWE